MTYEEAKEILEMSKDERMFTHQHEAIDVAIEALDKRIPKEPIFAQEEHVQYYFLHCPTCKNVVAFNELHCSVCGQRIDWSK